MALVGQKPSPERVDGFWISMVDSAPSSPAEVSGDSIAVIAEFGMKLHAELTPIDQRRQEEEKRLNEEIQKLNQLSYSNRMLYAESRKNKVEEIIKDESLRPVLERIVHERWNYDRFRQHRKAIIGEMMDSGLSEQEAEKAMRDIEAAPLKNYPIRRPPPKTDPVTESIEVIKNIE